MDQISPGRDGIFKEVFTDKRLILELLQNYTPIDLFQHLSLDDIETQSLPTEHLLPSGYSEHSDVIQRIRIKGQPQQECCHVIALFEHQSGVDHRMVFRTFHYMDGIWRRYEAEREAAEARSTSRATFKWPPILPIVFYDGQGNWTAAKTLSEKIEHSELFAGYLPDFSYQLVNLQQYSSDQLLEHGNVLALVLTIDKGEDFAIVGPKILALYEKLEPTMPEYLRNLIARVIDRLLYRREATAQERQELVERIKEKGVEAMAELMRDYSIPKLREEGRQEGRQEGRLEGRKEGRQEGRLEGRQEGERQKAREVAKNLLAMGMSIEHVAKATGLSLEDIEQLQRELAQ